MKKYILSVFFGGIALALVAQQPGGSSIDLRNMDGAWVNSRSITNEGKPLMLVFWNFDSKESRKQVQALSTAGTEMLSADQVKMVGIFVDNGGNWQSKTAQIEGSDYGMEVYIDINGSYMRSMCVPGLPYTQIYDPDFKLICSYYGYCSGAEDMVCKKVKACLALRNQ